MTAVISFESSWYSVASTVALTMPPLRQHPTSQPVYDEEAEIDPDQERIEIPAFLRRQAN